MECDLFCKNVHLIKSIDVEIVPAGKTGLKLKYANEMWKKHAARTFLNAVTLNSWKCRIILRDKHL